MYILIVLQFSHTSSKRTASAPAEGDFGEVMTNSWIFGRTATLQTHGPEGLKKVVGGFAQAAGFGMAKSKRGAVRATMMIVSVTLKPLCRGVPCTYTQFYWFSVECKEI